MTRNQSSTRADTGPGQRRRAVLYTFLTKDDPTAQRQQEQICHQLATQHQLRVLAVFHDVGSTFAGGRTGWHTIQDMMRGGEVDVLIAARTDRLAHNPREARELRQFCRATAVDVLTLDGEIPAATDRDAGVPQFDAGAADREDGGDDGPA